MGEALQSVAGINLLHDRFQYNLGLRGINGGMRSWSRIVKVMIDGQPVSYRPSSENFLGNELIPLSVIDRIEIIRGPASALYGSNAFLGGINIVTRRSKLEKWGELSMHLGNSKYLDGYGSSVTVGGKSGNFDFIAAGVMSRSDQSGVSPVNVPGAALYRSDQYSENEISRPRSVFSKFHYEDERIGQFNMQFNYQSLDSFGEFQDWAVLTHNNRISIHNFHLRSNYSRELSDNFTGKFSLAYAQGQPSSNDELDTDTDPSTRISRDVGYRGIDVNAEFEYRIAQNKNLTVGFDHTTDIQDLQTHYLNYSNSQKFPLQNLEYGEKNFTNTGVYLQSIYYPNNSLGFTAGLRYDEHNIYGNVYNLRLASVYQLSGAIYLKLLYGSSYKAPSSVQLFSNYILPQGVVGNPGLKPEKAKTLEAAIGLRLGANLNLNMNAFVNRINEKVELVLPLGHQSNIQPENIARINSAGLEIEAMHNYRHLMSYANVSFQKSVSEKEHPIRGRIRLDTELFPSYMFKFGTNYRITNYHLNLNLEGRFTDSRLSSEINSFIFDPTKFRTERYELGSYFLMDFTISSNSLKLLTDKETTIAIKVYNIFDEEYSYPGFNDFDIPGFERRLIINFTQAF